MGLRLAEATGGTVTLISMGPTGRAQGIRQALAMGADRAVIVDDETLEGADALTTARILAAAAGHTGFDLVICGTESTDGYSGVVPQMLAELLGVAALTYATGVEVGRWSSDHPPADQRRLRRGGRRPPGPCLGDRRGGGTPLSDFPGESWAPRRSRPKLFQPPI